ncbi:MAG: alpha/beta fold hydrolase [Chloroflexaceae bacterium]|nr:alpha/beta fold hydrolase [Chloroflexaceae bacterium]
MKSWFSVPGRPRLVMFVRGWPVLAGIVFLSGVLIMAGPPGHAQAQTSWRCFAETGMCIKGRIREFWEQNGGLPVFGLPMTPQTWQDVGGRAVQVQWFERARLEIHPENARPYDVLIGHVGRERFEQGGGQFSPPPTHASSLALPDEHDGYDEQEGECSPFPETGYQVCGAFLETWRSSGLELDDHPGTSRAESLSLFGLPLTEARTETLADGNRHTVQWFERARFEWHPEQAPANRVLLGLLGRELRGEAWNQWPRFEPSACPFGVPGGIRVECGYLTVPEDRRQPASRPIQLAVAVVPARGAAPVADPVVYLSGGPGSAALASTVTFAQGWSWLLANRDFVVLDQRGTGFSRPALACPELAQLAVEVLGQEMTRAEKVRAEIDTALQCRNRLVSEGVNVAGYTSAATVADLNDLRLALGYDQFNLFGISYGTRVALTAMRDYPHMLRSVVLDSTYPLQANLFTEMPANMDRSLSTLFRNCASNPTCRQNDPDLETVFYDLVAQLDANPVTVWPVNPHTGRSVKVRVDGTELLSLMFRLLYDTQAIPSLPQMIAATRNGNYEMLTSMEQRRLGRTGGSFSHGLYFSVECGEEIAFTTEHEVLATLEAFPHLRPFFEGIPENTTEIFRLCGEWGMHPPDPAENAPVVSEVPALILAGEYDPITPPAWGRLVAETLSHSSVYEFPGTGHAVITRGACPQSLIRAFLDNPMQPPDGECVR